MEDYKAYEEEKKKLKNLSNKEYEQIIKELLKKIEV